MMRKVYCATLGCDKNLVDSEALLGRFAVHGVQAVNDLDEADIWVLNSCGFIDAARSDSEETLQALIDHKTSQTLVVCGCWSQEHGLEIQEKFPGVDVVAGVGQFDRVVASCLGKEVATVHNSQAAVAFPMAGKPMIADPMEADYTGMLARPLLTPGHLAFVKIGEGCNFNCTFCRIPMIRGRQISRPIDELVREVQGLASRGVTEIQLVSQNTSDFGRDTGQDLYSLVKSLNGVEGLKSIRLLYLYSGMVSTDDLLRLLDLEKVARYLEMPVQHASPRILKAMKRPGGDKSSPEFFNALRRHHPDLALRSTAILGFPGEEEEDVEMLADFLAEVQFDHLGTYRYSPEKGTPSAQFADQVPQEVIFDREALIMDLQSEISQKRQSSRLGKVFDVVVDKIIDPTDEDSAADVEILRSLDEAQWLNPQERSAPWDLVTSKQPVAIGRSYHYGYDIDGVVIMPGRGIEPGQWMKSEFRAATPYDTWALPISDVQTSEGSLK
jgi:ribosomal protein S12 methylthiotransferase